MQYYILKNIKSNNFSRFAGGYGISAWLDSLVNGRFRE